ncbi:GH92 family glycosyl hydrolase [Streptomyces sp. V4-01]|uniref:GH92 family glycosyl hydrolase n=1 Tax=Actinacidiphila polyblastidii TaxID=3110430 RepID=A0ABU7PLY9_9ACTN|nr:GH92 family glycosyl hydrolase [Streptomyces sp. V4-01]
MVRPHPLRRAISALSTVGLLAGVGLTQLVFSPPVGAAVSDPAAAVNTLVGSSNSGETFPGADTPFGMVQWSPENTRGDQTRTPQPGGYDYGVTRVRGFSLTHMSGTGCAGGAGDVPILPYAGAVTSSPTSDRADATYAATFSHANETGTAGSYRVGLDSGVNVELSASTHTGAGRFTYPTGKTPSLLVRTSNSEVGSSAAQTTIDTANRAISGSVTSGNFCGYINDVDRRSYYTLYFYAAFDKPFASTGTWKDGTLSAGSTSSSGGTTYGTDGWPVAGKGSGGYVTFDPNQGQSVGVRVGISYVSAANAKANLDAENPAGTTFDTVKQRAHDAWNTELNRLAITGGSATQQATFYTALYHSLLHPNVFSDTNGQYVGMDQKTHTVSGNQRAQYANFSGWDVYRDQVQLVTLLRPDVGADIAQSLYNQANQNNGVWDRWTHNQGGTHVMTGDPGPAAASSIYAFGGTSFDAAGALTSMVHAATTVTAEDRSRDGWNVMVTGERPSLDRYLSIGYVPSDGNAWGGAGETLEDVSADFGISQLAQRLNDTTTGSQFLARAQNWKNVFNPGTGYIQERNSSGAWDSFDPASDNGFAEGSAAQYTWMVPFNAKGLFASMGGSASAASRLDKFFHNSDGSWALSASDGTHSDLSNEPSIGTPWLYDFAGQPYKTEQTVRQVVNTLWSDSPGGIPGQDDLGAMSSWYVFAAMGVYPLAPGRADLLLASPLFSQIVVHRGNGVTLTLNATGAGTDAPYIQSMKVNGAVSTRPWLPESLVTSGGTVDMTLGSTANTSWGTAAGDAPPSFDSGSASADVALNKPATADSSCNGDESAAKAVNGSVSGGTADKWCSLGGTTWWRVDLGGPTPVRTLTVRHAGAGGESTAWNTRDYDIQASDDGTTWTTLVQARGNTASVTTHAVSVTTRYLKLNVLTPEQSGTGGAARIYEFEAYS